MCPFQCFLKCFHHNEVFCTTREFHCSGIWLVWGTLWSWFTLLCNWNCLFSHIQGWANVQGQHINQCLTIFGNLLYFYTRYCCQPIFQTAQYFRCFGGTNHWVFIFFFFLNSFTFPVRFEKSVVDCGDYCNDFRTALFPKVVACMQCILRAHWFKDSECSEPFSMIPMQEKNKKRLIEPKQL